ncbi:MAG: peptidoglycan-binding protein [Clostridia bacterium]|nr:peptidoglycan-binding protein [Clostridia bacterium]
MKRLRLTALIIINILVISFTGFAMAETICQPGDSGTEVRVVQSRLYTLGYMDDEPASPYTYDSETKKAVEKFQTGSSLECTGIVDSATYEAIKLSTAIDYEGYLDVIHQPGQSGEEVTATKKRLKTLGYFSGTVNEKYNDATEQAVTTFQMVHSLSQTGCANKATRDVLFGSDVITYAEYQSSVQVTQLKKGARGDGVTRLQTALKNLNYYDKSINGYYNANTVVSVKLFETGNSLKSDGVADTVMLTLLYSGSAKSYDDYLSEQSLVMVELGDTGLPVTLLQERLTELYYYSGKINGVFNAAVKESVERFQNANDVNVSGTTNHGKATVATRAKMNSSSAIDRVEAEGLVVGDTMEEVSTMTARLKALGYLTATYAKYNATVKTAVSKFQSANGLSSTGIADPDTLEAIYSSSAVTYAESQQSSSSATIEKMIEKAYLQLGKAYASPCSVPKTFDCSNFTRFVVRKMGITIPAEVTAQGRAVAKKYTKITDPTLLERGDLVYFDTQSDKPIGHAAIYLGKVNGQRSFIHASSSAGKVLVTVFSTWYKERFLFGARIWE